MSLVEWGTDLILDWISTLGYPGIFMLMTIEGIITPIPSELIVPFAGYLAAEGEMSLPLVVVAASTGAALGNTVAYFIGYRVGRPLIQRYGRYIMLDERDLVSAERWFAKYGDVGVLLGHAVPGIRSFISFPAGIGRMRFRNFIVFSTLGAFIWTSVLALAGYLLLDEWRRFADATENIDLIVVIAAIAVIVGYLYWTKKRRSQNAGE